MKKIILRTGTRSLVAMVVFFVISAAVGNKMGYAVQEVLGYAGIIVSLLFVYFGIRQYRDQVNGGIISFGQAIKVGLLIVLLPSVLFGLLDLLYVTLINPGFYESYYQANLEKMKSTLSAAEFAVKSVEMEKQKEMIAGNKFLQFFIMFLTVFIIGFIITIISAISLRRDNKVLVA